MSNATANSLLAALQAQFSITGKLLRVNRYDGQDEKTKRAYSSFKATIGTIGDEYNVKLTPEIFQDWADQQGAVVTATGTFSTLREGGYSFAVHAMVPFGDASI